MTGVPRASFGYRRKLVPEILYDLTGWAWQNESAKQYRDNLNTYAQEMAKVPPMVANNTQVGGTHYKSPIEHWDWVIANNMGYMEGQITKYVARWRKKNGIQDLEKARHFLDKLIEVEKARAASAAVAPSQAYAEEAGPGYVNQD